MDESGHPRRFVIRLGTGRLQPFILVFPVPNAPKSAGTANPAKASVPFEEALQKLESIVEAMESGDLPLEGLLSKYEEGMNLAKICQEKLADAEVKIQQLEKSASGELKLKPLTAELSES